MSEKYDASDVTWTDVPVGNADGVLIWMAVRVRWWQRLPLVRRWFTTEASRDNGARIEWTEEGVAFYE